MEAQDLGSEMLPLSPEHLKRLLEISGLSEDVVRARGYQSVTTESHAANYRENGWGNLAAALPALEIPLWTVDGNASIPQLRPDNPKVNAKGKAMKYVYPQDEMMRIDVHPSLVERIKGTEPLVITEGVIKADSAVSRGLCCIALLGVWNFRGKNAHGGTTVLGDWQSINLKGRQVYIAFDSDVTVKSEVQKALIVLRTFLTSKGAICHTVRFAPGPNDEKTGIDDYFARDHHTVSDFWALAEAAEVDLDEEQKRKQSAELLERLNTEIAWLKDPMTYLVIRDPDSLRFAGPRELALDYATLKSPDSKKGVIGWWTEQEGRREFDRIVFAPGTTDDRSYNLWRGWPVEATKGDCTLYWDHIRTVICDGDDAKYTYVRKWMAHAVQKPAELPRVGLIMTSDEGSGKGTFVEYFGQLFGAHFVSTSRMDNIVGRFNEHLAHAMVLFADEATWGGHKQSEGIIKAIVTEATTEIEQKNKPKYEVENFKRFIVASNHDRPIAVGHSDRRFVFLRVNNVHCAKSADHRSYFNAIHKQMKSGGLQALMYDLLHEDISGWDPRNRPQSASTWDIKVQGLDMLPRFWYDFLFNGYTTWVDSTRDERSLWYPADPNTMFLVNDELHAAYKHFCMEHRAQFMDLQRFLTQSAEYGLVGTSTRLRVGGMRTQCRKVGDFATARAAFEVFVNELAVIWNDGLAVEDLAQSGEMTDC